MNTLNLKMTGAQHLKDALVYIDDKPVKLAQNEYKNLVCKFETEKDKVILKVYKALDIGGIGWFVVQILFFIISIFGIFDIHPKKRYLGLLFETEIELTENSDVTLSCYQPRENSKVFDVETTLKTTEKENKFYIDEKAKKKLKWLLISKIVTALVIAAIVIMVIFI